MTSHGRPRFYNPLGQRFRQIYLDPLVEVEEACRRLKISRATFYNYEKEMNLPKLRVGFGTASQLPGKQALRGLVERGERYELEIIRFLGNFLGARIKLVPLFSGDGSAVSAVSRREVDFALASLSWTKRRSERLYFSDAYFLESPWGQLLQRKGHAVLLGEGRERPLLGVASESVHHDYAIAELRREFVVKIYPSVPANLGALLDEKVDFLLAHPSILDLYPERAALVRVLPRKFSYRSHTGIVFHADSEHWRGKVNQGLSALLQMGRGQ